MNLCARYLSNKLNKNIFLSQRMLLTFFQPLIFWIRFEKIQVILHHETWATLTLVLWVFRLILSWSNAISSFKWMQHVVSMDLKGCICHFVERQIHPFISKGTILLFIKNEPHQIELFDQQSIYRKICYKFIDILFSQKCAWKRIYIYIRS